LPWQPRGCTAWACTRYLIFRPFSFFICDLKTNIVLIFLDCCEDLMR
jgi:hypothetical protein